MEEQSLTSTLLNVFLLDVNFNKSTIRFIGLKWIDPLQIN